MPASYEVNAHPAQELGEDVARGLEDAARLLEDAHAITVRLGERPLRAEIEALAGRAGLPLGGLPASAGPSTGRFVA